MRLPLSQEVFLALHDWDGQMLASGDGSMNPAYNFSTINGKMLGFWQPIEGEARPAGSVAVSSTPARLIRTGYPSLDTNFESVALDGNPVPQQRKPLPMLRSPAERVCAIVEMSQSGRVGIRRGKKTYPVCWNGRCRQYSGCDGAPVWQQPQTLSWNYNQFAALANRVTVSNRSLVFRWCLNPNSPAMVQPTAG